jgi:TDG/mug DNA glycosylase family protein
MRTSRPAAIRPSREEVLAAAGSTIPDVIAANLKVLFCGINPGLYSGATGYHFARPGNRFWTTLHSAGFTDRLLSPAEGRDLIALGYGLTNLVARATARAEELSAAELVRGRQQLERMTRYYCPRWVAVLGISAYRVAFDRPRAQIGLQPERSSGAMLWVLPSPSGLNAHYQPGDLVRAFGELHEAVEGSCG